MTSEQQESTTSSLMLGGMSRDGIHESIDVQPSGMSDSIGIQLNMLNVILYHTLLFLD